jgi:hypothetical protein
MAVIEDRKSATTFGDIRNISGYMNATSNSMLNGGAFNQTLRVISTISPNCVSVS